MPAACSMERRADADAQRCHRSASGSLFSDFSRRALISLGQRLHFGRRENVQHIACSKLDIAQAKTKKSNSSGKLFPLLNLLFLVLAFHYTNKKAAKR